MKQLTQFGSNKGLESQSDNPLLLTLLRMLRPEILSTIDGIYNTSLQWKGPAKSGTSLFAFLEIMPFDKTLQKGSTECIVSIKPNAGEITKHANSIIKSHVQKVKGVGEKVVVFENLEKKATAYANSLSVSLPDGNFALKV
jgi:hypothetical protein